MLNDTKKKMLYGVIYAVVLGILFALLFWVNQKTCFMMDDEWYATNLVTGEKLRTVSDIIESQKWHYDNWGGRSVTHGILQLTLMSGELWANIFNVTATALLVFMICVLCGHKNMFSYLLSLSLVISLNANIKTSMLWQSGVVNYVYATAWIFLYLWLYLRDLDQDLSQKKFGQSKAVQYLIGFAQCVGATILGTMTGWSNENMGPAAFLLAAGVLLYRKLLQKKKNPVWMYFGIVSAGVGSILCIVAPGNFVRSAEIQYDGMVSMLMERIIMMLQAGAEFLLPSMLLCLLLGCISYKYQKEICKPGILMLVIMAVLAFGAMALSPHFPDRATFGIMCLLIVVAVYFLQEFMQKFPKFRYCGYVLLICSVLISSIKMLSIIVLQ